MIIGLYNLDELKINELSIDDLVDAASRAKEKAHNTGNGLHYEWAGYYLSLGNYFQNAAIIRQNEEIIRYMKNENKEK